MFRVCRLLQLNTLSFVLGVNESLNLVTKLFFVAGVIANYIEDLLKNMLSLSVIEMYLVNARACVCLFRIRSMSARMLRQH